MPVWSILISQNGITPGIENLFSFNDHSIVVLVLILAITGLMGILTILFKRRFFRISEESQEIEIFWSCLPTIILLIIAVPSLKLLYLLEEPINSSLRVKIIGHQWYWSYEYSDFDNVSFDSFIVDQVPRNLMTRNILILPSITSIRFLVSSTDVIHSWAIPSIGRKIDAIPGRVNQFYSIISRVGVLSGQCSEICGINHSFMPINISSIPSKEFIKTARMMFFRSFEALIFWINKGDNSLENKWLTIRL